MRKLLPLLLLTVTLFAQEESKLSNNKAAVNQSLVGAGDLSSAPAPLSQAKKHELFDIRSAANEDLKNFQKSHAMDQLNKDQEAAKKAQEALSGTAEYKAAKKASDAVDADVAKVKESAEYKALQAKQDAFEKAKKAAVGGVDPNKWRLDDDFDWYPVPPVQSTQEKK